MASQSLVWKFNRFRQFTYRSRAFRGVAFLVQNVVLAYYMKVFAASGKSLWPSSVSDFANHWNGPGYEGLLLSILFSLGLVVWFPSTSDPIVQAVEDAAAGKLSELVNGATSFEEVLGHLKAVTKARNK